MAFKLDHADQLKYGTEAQHYARTHGISFIDACAVIVEKHDLPIAPKTLSNNFARFETVMKSVEDTDEDNSFLDDLYDPQGVINELERELRVTQKKLEAAQNKNDVMIRTMHRVVTSIKRGSIAPFKRPNYKANRREVAMIDLSDLHLGKKIDPRDTAGINSYDSNVFENQCQLLREAVSEIVDIQRRGGIQIDHLYVNLLGDIVDGEMIYGGHQGELFRRVIDQMYELGEYLLTQVLAPFGEIFENVTILAVDGNHGRVGHKREGYDRKLNFDNILVRYWEQRLQNHKDIFKFHISESPYLLYRLFGKLHLLSHMPGSGSARYPMAGLERFLNGVSSLNRKIIDYVHVAHYHRDMKFDFNFCDILANGCWVGPTEFTVGKMSAGNYPFQRFYGLNKKHITWTYPIYLDKHIMVESDFCGDINSEVEVLTPTTTPLNEITFSRRAPEEKN